MLQLFRDEESRMDCEIWTREYWEKSLDKARPPHMEEILTEWGRLFPHQPFQAPGWLDFFLSFDWLFLELPPETREILGLSPKHIEVLGPNEFLLITCPIPGHLWPLWVETLATKYGLEFNYSAPSISRMITYKGEHFRLTLMHQTVATDQQHKFFLRKLNHQARSLKSFGTDAVFPHLEEMMNNKANVLLAGATGSGKTSLMQSLLTLINKDEHVVLLEETREIFHSAPKFTSLLASSHPNRSIVKLLDDTLRMSPDRILLGEIRAKEVVPYLLAMNTGHSGLMATIHANNARDALHRITQLYSLASGQEQIQHHEVLRMVCSNIHHVIFMKNRQITEIIKVYGCTQQQPHYDLLYEKN
jgi:type IV secretion system protein VirB11